MLISKISLFNYRIYKGENQIVFDEDPFRNIHIVSGYNGFGKTTFLTSLVWCLYGAQMQDVDESFKKRIKDIGGYPRFLEDSLNRNAYLSLETKYYVEISFSGVDVPGIIAEELKIRRSFHSGDKTDTVQIWLDGQPNELVQEVGFDLFIQDFILPKEIAKFFFFDAEKITELAEIQTLDQKRQLAKAYSEVLGIKKYADLRANLHEQRLKYRRESANATEVKTFEELEGQIETLVDRIQQENELLNEVNLDIDRSNEIIDELQEKLIRAGNVISVEDHQKLKDRKAQLLVQTEELKEKFKRHLDLAPFAIAGKLFHNMVATAKEELSLAEDNHLEHILPLIGELGKKAALLKTSISKEQLGELIRPLLGEYENLIENKESKENASKIGFSPKSFHIIEHLEEQLHHVYQDEVKEVTRDMKRNRYDMNEVNRLLSHAEAKGNDVIVNRNRENLHHKQAELNNHLVSKGKVEERISTFTNELNNKKKVREELQKKVHLQEDLLEKDATAKRLIDQLDEFILKIQQQKKTTLQSRILDTLRKLMHKSSFIHDVKIVIENEIIDIDLVNKAGKLINKEGLSMGEKQLYATAILQALVKESNFDFPVFIDSPMQKLDATHATNIIKHFYPNVSKQVILLPLLQKEMSEQEFDLLESNVKSTHLIYHKADESSSTFIHVDNKELFNTVNSLNADSHV
ncbi:DNA sulfur modification protein DndD [Sphingobacterium nematocida]|uniref:DNA sulfur modification protein DndD n=1 Tax=Sphingobacterium nematocida TaxID=1513896 RepID=A0A1T5B0K4_9SPHI|nr:DNA sulfur modification protein DndD [Sphingobacterium nematocida]SKB40745.1 DNA sulfur modification protein DndD [Sphingobacterium nematocida]